jgi:15-cis-phytoene synthase
MLADYRSRLSEALAGGPQGPLFRELGWAVQRYGVPASAIHELLDGVARDCAPLRHETWLDLARYCEGVASSVGEMCMYVFGVPGDDARRARALHHARTLGLAMQLTNILRDVGEDARNGRCYLPEHELAWFGLSRADVLRGDLGTDARWRVFMIHQVRRARELYAEAMPGIALLSPDARRCATACAVGYAAILDVIAANGYDTFRARARLGRLARVSVLWTAWCAARDVEPGSRGAMAKPVGSSPRATLVRSA